jgi:putative oligomerization/nucleic acid binding protein/phospholipase D-like protein
VLAYTFWQVMWSMIVFFAWLMFVAWVIMLLIDNFQRDDHSGWAKAGWALMLIFLPILGAVCYVIARPKEVDVPSYSYADQSRPRVYPATASSAASEIARLNELRAEGALSEDEFQMLKAKAIASA